MSPGPGDVTEEAVPSSGFDSASARPGHRPRHVVGAYAASPAHRRWDPMVEDQFLTALAALPDVGAFEMPWMGSLHPHDDSWLLEHLPENIDVIFTDIPFVMKQLAETAEFGLAASRADDRTASIAAVARMREDIARLNDHRGRRVVSMVELHSAPRRHAGSADAFARSLAEISSWDWGGTDVIVEHCDAEVKGQEPEKGFLTLEEEIGAIRAAGVDVGMSINWGRSAIELRDPNAVADQVAEAAASGLLRGVMLSGASDREGIFGRAWLDAHHPFRRNERHPFGDPLSVLTDERALAALNAAGVLDWVGVKLGWPDDDGRVEDRVQMIAHACSALKRQASDVGRANLSIS